MAIEVVALLHVVLFAIAVVAGSIDSAVGDSVLATVGSASIDCSTVRSDTVVAGMCSASDRLYSRDRDIGSFGEFGHQCVFWCSSALCLA